MWEQIDPKQSTSKLITNIFCLFSYDIMYRCWNEQSELRPTFPDMRQSLERLLRGSGRNSDDVTNHYTRVLTRGIPTDYHVYTPLQSSESTKL